MPGYNHFPDCTCGWCWKQSKDSVKYEYVPACTGGARILRQSGVSRSTSACFVTPNASCPECGQKVFYYSNANGSRVFFDGLGIPCPKHPCTDRGRRGPLRQ